MPQFSITSEINVDALRQTQTIIINCRRDLPIFLELAERFGWVSVDHLAVNYAFEKWRAIVGM